MTVDTTVKVLRSLTVPKFNAQLQPVNVARITIMVGNAGPYQQDFGPGEAYPDTVAAINQWKQERVAYVMGINT